jgi:protein phosphatase PTC7
LFNPPVSLIARPRRYKRQTDGFSDNVHPHQLVGLLKHVDNTLASPENAFLDPLEREVERARLLADVLVAYGRMVMGREDVQTPFESESSRV